jgi:hypothetical protein
MDFRKQFLYVAAQVDMFVNAKDKTAAAELHQSVQSDLHTLSLMSQGDGGKEHPDVAKLHQRFHDAESAHGL